MAPRTKPEPNVDVEPWERWTRDVCGKDEPLRLHRIFIEYAKTNPRSLRVALIRAAGLTGKAARSARASGGLYRASQYWSWRRRADEWDKHNARVEKAAFDARRAAARRRRLDQLDKLSDALGLRLGELAEKATLEGLLKLHAAEQIEYTMLKEDEPDDVGLPALEDRIKPPEATDHKPDHEPEP